MAKNIATVAKRKVNVKREAGKITISTFLADGKQMTVKKNDRGWYRLWGGAFNTNNGRGDSYPYNKTIEKEFTDPNSGFARRMAEGVVGGETNHPDLHLLDSKAKQMFRLNKLEKKLQCLQVMEVELDTKSFVNPDGSKVVGVWVWVKPTGPYADAFKAALDDPEINVCLSLRMESANKMRPDGTMVRTLTKPLHWDWVDINGMPNANKRVSSDFSQESLFDYEISYADACELCDLVERDGISQESLGMDVMELRQRLAVECPETDDVFKW